MGRLEEKVCSNIHLLLEKLDINSYFEQGDKIITSCPIHGGDNERAFVLYLTGEKYCGNWKCFTRGCEGNLYDLVSQLLNISIEESKDYLADMYSGSQYQPRIIQKKNNNKICMDIDEFKEGVIIPSLYYIRRGFSKNVLNYFSAGFCNKKSNNMFLRTAIPVFNLDKTGIIGVVGRSVFEECVNCKSYHHPNSKCIEGWKSGIYSKWKNSPGFYSGETLYNIWNIEGDTAIVVEGISDVWRMVEAGYNNTVSIFGMVIKPQQHLLLKEKGIKNLILVQDNDDAGDKGIEIFKNKYGRDYTYEVKRPPKKDVSLMTTKEIKEFMK